MEAVTAKRKQGYKFNRKLTDEEIARIIENYDYDPKYADPDYFDKTEPGEPGWDEFGNPTESTIRAKYEALHNIGTEPMTLDDLFAEWRELYEETEE